MWFSLGDVEDDNFSGDLFFSTLGLSFVLNDKADLARWLSCISLNTDVKYIEI